MTPQSTSTFTQRERVQLCNLFDTVGPAAPTLCAGWTTLDLAAHLVTRERRPDAAVGIILKSAQGWTEKVQNEKRQEGLQKLVGLIREGPPNTRPSAYSMPHLIPSNSSFIMKTYGARSQVGNHVRFLMPTKTTFGKTLSEDPSISSKRCPLDLPSDGRMVKGCQ